VQQSRLEQKHVLQYCPQLAWEAWFSWPQIMCWSSEMGTMLRQRLSANTSAGSDYGRLSFLESASAALSVGIF
jgi:hypothetical protein